MGTVKFRHLPAVVLGALVLAALGCPPVNTKYQAAATRTDPVVAAAAVEGKEFNKFFPKGDAIKGHDFTFTQEKTGLALGKLSKEGKDLATLSITDTLSEPDAKEKFQDSTEKIEGFPVGAESKLETCLLVDDRFQVKVRSAGTAADQVMPEADRKEWLKKFDLTGLSKLK
jgi:hypothetical protein